MSALGRSAPTVNTFWSTTHLFAALFFVVFFGLEINIISVASNCEAVVTIGLIANLTSRGQQISVWTQKNLRSLCWTEDDDAGRETLTHTGRERESS